MGEQEHIICIQGNSLKEAAWVHSHFALVLFCSDFHISPAIYSKPSAHLLFSCFSSYFLPSSHWLCGWIMGALVILHFSMWNWQHRKDSPSVRTPQKWRDTLSGPQTASRMLWKQCDMQHSKRWETSLCCYKYRSHGFSVFWWTSCLHFMSNITFILEAWKVLEGLRYALYNHITFYAIKHSKTDVFILKFSRINFNNKLRFTPL